MFFILCGSGVILFRYVATHMAPQENDISDCGKTAICSAVPKIIVLTGCVFIILTGIFPDFEGTHLWLPPYFHDGKYHGLGVIVPFLLCVVYPWISFLILECGKPHYCVGAFVRTIHVAVLFLVPIWIASTMSDFPPPVDPSNYCSQMSKATCNDWPCTVEAGRALTNANCTNVEGKGIDLLCTPRYTCKWVSSELEPAQKIFSSDAWLSSHSGMCIKHECNLYDNAANIQAEFVGLWMMYTYFVSYTLFDITSKASSKPPDEVKTKEGSEDVNSENEVDL